MRIDVHCHYAPVEYLELLRGREGYPRVEMRDKGYFVTNAVGTGYIAGPEVYDPKYKIKQMDAAGVDMQAMSIIVPGSERVEAELAVKLARACNDDLAQLQKDYPSRCVGVATIPMEYPALAVAELDRAIKELNLRGIQIHSNVAGRPLDDPDFWPVYKRAAELDIPIIIHPTMPVMIEQIKDPVLVYVLGFIYDTSLAMMRLILSGVLEKYPDVKFLLCHLGSSIPYLLGRIDCESIRVLGGLGKLSKPPSEYFRQVYMDTVSLHAPAFKCAYDTSGPDKILFGSDYPSWQMTDAVASVDSWPMSDEDRLKIHSDNAKKLFKID